MRVAQDYIIDGQTLTDIGNAIREKAAHPICWRPRPCRMPSAPSAGAL